MNDVLYVPKTKQCYSCFFANSKSVKQLASTQRWFSSSHMSFPPLSAIFLSKFLLQCQLITIGS